MGLGFLHRRRGSTPYLLLAPGMLFLVVFFLVPLGFLAYQSLESGSIDFGYAFTWAWDHEPAAPTRTVTLQFAPDGAEGTHLTVTHGPYGDSTAEQAARQGHIDGWLHFLLRLQAVC